MPAKKSSRTEKSVINKESMSNVSSKAKYGLALTRIALGLIFLWAFLDKLLGLGFATKPENAWLAGGSPTTGFLAKGVHGPLAGFYNALSGVGIVDWLFMLGLLGLGIALIFGIAIRFAGYAGIVLMLLMWSALLPPSNHPFIDDHIIYALVLYTFIHFRAGDVWGCGKEWRNSSFAKKFPIFQ